MSCPCTMFIPHAKRELARSVREERDRRPLERGQVERLAEVGEHDLRRALAAFAAVERDPQRYALARADDVGRVGTLHDDLDRLDAVLEVGELGTARPEEEPGTERRQHDGRQR